MAIKKLFAFMMVYGVVGGMSACAQSPSVQPVAPTQPVEPAIPNGKGVELSTHGPVSLPVGSVAIIRLYDSMLMDTNSTYAETQIILDTLPVILPMPVPPADISRRIVGPAVNVTIRDPNGQLVYWSDTVTPINEGPLTRVVLKSSR